MIITQSQKKIQKIPRIRFPEFSGAIEVKSLRDIFEKKQERNSDNKEKHVLTNSAVEGIVNQQDYFDKDIANKDNLTNYYVVDIDDFIYNPRISKTAPVGPFKRNNLQKGIMSPLYTVLKPKAGDLSFLEHYFQTRCWHRYMFKIANYGARHDRMNILQGDFMKLPIPFPSVPEQQKVSSFINSANEWIVNVQSQKENLIEYKKGIMQKIFSQEIRFKDDGGKNFPQWEEKKLEEILKERKEYSTKGKGYPHISLTTQGVVPKSERYNRDFLVGDDEIKGYKITRLNDLCYNPANLKFGVISINKLGAGIFSPIYVTFEIIGQNIDFVGYYLIRNEFINKARRYEQGTVYERMAVSPADFVKVKVAFPSLPEQQKIADFLISLDKAIEAKQQQIILAEKWKKGLMQGLFI
jgi:type I restriction enzyme S subunit